MAKTNFLSQIDILLIFALFPNSKYFSAFFASVWPYPYGSPICNIHFVVYNKCKHKIIFFLMNVPEAEPLITCNSEAIQPASHFASRSRSPDSISYITIRNTCVSFIAIFSTVFTDHHHHDSAFERLLGRTYRCYGAHVLSWRDHRMGG